MFEELKNTMNNICWIKWITPFQGFCLRGDCFAGRCPALLIAGFQPVCRNAGHRSANRNIFTKNMMKTLSVAKKAESFVINNTEHSSANRNIFTKNMMKTLSVAKKAESFVINNTEHRFANRNIFAKNMIKTLSVSKKAESLIINSAGHRPANGKTPAKKPQRGAINFIINY